MRSGGSGVKPARHAVPGAPRDVPAALAALADSLPLIVWIAGVDGGPLYFNRRWTGYTGISARPDSADPWLACIHPDDRPAVGRERAAAVAARRAYAIEYRLRRHDGVYGWFHESGEPRQDEAGVFAGLTASCTNVDGRRLAESALLDSEDRFRRFMANAPAVAYIKDLGGRYAWVNEAFLATFALTPQELLGRSDADLYGAERGHALRATDLRVLAHRGPERAEEVTVLNGEERVWLSHKFPLRQPSGEWALGGVSVDITELKRTERELRESTVRLKVAFEAARIAAWTWDRSTRSFHAPDGMGPVFGVAEPGTWTNEQLLARVHPEDAPIVRAAGLRALSGSGDYQLETRVIWPDGSVHWVESRGAWERNERGEAVRLVGVALDVTARKMAERGLRERDDVLRLSFDAARLVPWRWDPGRQEFSSPHGFGAMFGLAGAERWADELFIAAVHPEDRAPVIAAVRDAFRRGIDFYAKFRVVWPDRSLHWIESRGQWQAAEPGQRRALVGVSSDVTVRELADRALEESEQRLHLALGAARMASWDWDAATGLCTSPNVAELYGLGVGPTELPMDAYFDVIHPEDRPAARASWDRVVARPERRDRPLVNEFRVSAPDGSVRWLEVRATLQFDAEDRLTGMIGVTTDVTARKRTENALREANEQLRVAMHSARMASWIWDPAADLYTSPGQGLARMLDLDADVPISNDVMLARTVAEDRMKLAAVFAAVRDERGPSEFTVDYRIACRDGGLRWLECRGHVQRRGRTPPTQVIGITIDVTQRKRETEERERLQRQLQQAQKMESIGQLTGGIAHDFNNILASILGYSGLALDRFAPQLPPKLVEYLREVQTAGERARDLVAQMLAFSRGEHGALHRVHLPDLLASAVKMLRPMLPASTELATEVAPALPAVMSDEVQLQQVIVNLCINARDAMHGSGTIGFGLAAREIARGVCASCHQDVAGTFVALSVRDTGQGIPPRLAARVFEPFFSTKAQGKGTGMGLAMVHGIVHRQGGHLLLDANEPQGTVFTVLLPVAPSVAAERLAGPDRASPPAHRPAPAHLLVVDDEPAIRALMSEMLELHGYRVDVAGDGQQALARFCADPDRYDLLLTDQTMPGLTGIEIVRAIRARRADLPIILMTGYSANVDESSALAAGANVFLHKPLNGERLLAALAALIDPGSTTAP